MNHRNRGIALILNFENFENDPDHKRKRIGAELDTKALVKAFTYLDFKLDLYNDLTQSKLQEIINYFAERNYDNDDCFVCVLMSYGNDQKFITSDNKEFNLKYR